MSGDTGNGVGEQPLADLSSPADREQTLSTSGSGEDGPDAAIVDDVDLLARGSTVGRYVVLERLGAGAMGVVYAAFDPELDRRVALKLLRPQEESADQVRRQARMVREAKAIAKVSHPNVVAIHDVGVHGGQVFMAMEHLAGGTLRKWMDDKKRPWREIVKMFIAIGHGLAGAHAEGLIHRDFKPDNVLLDKNGVPKVVDFGLVRLSAAADLTSSDVFADTVDARAAAIPLPAAAGPAALTRTGALTGTPAYMAPEQFRGHDVDERTDQFAFCVALYEALYGERPFPGDNLIALADSVTIGRIQDSPKDTQVPAWVRRVLLRGLSVDRAGRFASFGELVAVLASDPIAKRRRAIVGAGIVLALMAGALTVRHVASRRQRQSDLAIAGHVREGEASSAKAGEALPQLLAHRASAMSAFDTMNRNAGERQWHDTLVTYAATDAAYQDAEKAFEAALSLDETRQSTRERLRRVLLDREFLAETFYQRTDALSHANKLARLDPPGTGQGLDDVGSISIVIAPHDVEVTLQRRGLESSAKWIPIKDATLDATAVRDLRLPPGSYRLTLRRTHHKTIIFFPFVVPKGGRVKASVNVPEDSDVPAGFIFVPGGEFLFGEADESMRTSFLDTAPIHSVSSPSFLIARNETTFGDWITYLESLPRDERKMRSPRMATSIEGLHTGDVRLEEVGPRRWQLALSPAGIRLSAMFGEPLEYPGRTERRSQDWRRFPVTGISPRDAEAYARWLAATRRAPGARLCSEREWERAARGADDRRFPNGDSLSGADANIDETYGRQSDAFGPDEIGSHPQSVSPFGLEDMAGNALEMTYSALDAAGFVARGGGFYHDKRSAWVTNRAALEPSTRLHTFGIRICADPPDPIRRSE